MASHAELSDPCGALARCDVAFVCFPHCCTIYRQDNEWRKQPRGEEAGSGRRKAARGNISWRKPQVPYTLLTPFPQFEEMIQIKIE